MTTMLIEWVATASFLILVVLALRKLLGRRISAGLRYALWAVVLLRLLVPVQLFTSPVAGVLVFSEVRMEQNVYRPADASGETGPRGEQPRQDSPAQSGAAAVQTGQGLTLPNGVPNPPQVPTVPDAPAAPRPTAELLAVLGWIWLGGSAAMGLALLVSNVSFVRRLRRGRIPLGGADCRAYVAVGLDSPCLFGLLRPAVYVTPETAADPDMLRHVLAHETTHRRHLDHVWNALRCAALAVHWWNPLVWLAVALSRRDGELACDEGALKRLGDGERRAYGHTLLTLVTAKPRPTDLLCCATTMAGDKKSLMERVSRIAKAPQRLLWAAVAAVLILALACACAFGRAADRSEAPDQGDQHHQSEHLGPSMDVEAVPEEVLDAALDYAESMYEDFLRSLEIREPYVKNVVFDDWRIEALEGPWTRNAQGTEVGVWRLDCTCHTTTPGQAKYLLAGGMTLSVDGWMTPTDSATWLIFLKDGDGKWQYSHGMEGGSSADDQPDSDFFWSRATNGIPGVTDPHFTADMTGIPGDVLSLASFYGEERLAACQAGVWEFNALPDGLIPGPGQIAFDDWRITSLKGPWRETVNGTEMEVWRLNCEVHTTEPERAEQALIGGMYLTEDGWFGPDYPDCTYLVFVKEADGGWRHCTDVIVNFCGPDDERFSSEGQAQFWKYIAEEVGIAADAAVYTLSQTPDLNRNGVPETMQIRDILYAGQTQPDGKRLEVWEDGELIWSDEGYMAHAGWNAVFLCTLDGQDYLLRYNPYGMQGGCSYTYKLFTLSPDGQEQAVQENSIYFYINVGSIFDDGSFDPDIIADFMDEINGLLAHSVQFVNTDNELLETFQKEGRLYDSLGWLDLDYTRDPNKTLRENLWDYRAAMEGAYYADQPEIRALDKENRHFRLTYHDKSVEFGGPEYQCQDGMDPQVMDLNRDGRNEIVFTANGDHSNGFRQENLYIFDAETLERYDTGQIWSQVYNQIQSTGDEENFYLSAPGMERVTLPRSIVKYDPRYDWNVYDAIEFGWCYYYDIDPDNGTLSFLIWGYGSSEVVFCAGIKVELKLTKTGVELGSFEFMPDTTGAVFYQEDLYAR